MNRLALSAIVGAGFAFRAATIWLTRPEFVGWFNHVYYYWVQTRGVLEDGALPFADLPLLFYWYAGLATVLDAMGLESGPAIVHATRFTMSLVPALIAVPVYLIVRRINAPAPLSLTHWALVAISAFLPLTIVHLPELLQKNALGMLLFATLMSATYALLRGFSRIRITTVAVFFVLIALTHLGTLAVALLFALAVGLALLLERADSRQTVFSVAVAIAAVAFGLAAIYVFDAAAFERVFRYARTSLPNSLLGALFAHEGASGRLQFLAGIVLPLAVIALLLRAWHRSRSQLNLASRTFWLANLLLAYLLVLPVLDLDVVPRLVLFMPLPALAVLAFHLRHGRPTKLRFAAVGLAAAGALLMVFGETMNLLRLYPDKNEVHAELRDARQRLALSEKDFVLTQYGVNPICNWFLGTPSGLVTAFNRDDLSRYDRVFVLNLPGAREPEALPGQDGVTYASESERYVAVRQNIPVPGDWQPIREYKHLELYEVEALPSLWTFDEAGDWIGWKSDALSPGNGIDGSAASARRLVRAPLPVNKYPDRGSRYPRAHDVLHAAPKEVEIAQ